MKLYVAVLLLAGPGFAQIGPQAEITGRVTDAATHEPIAGAQVSQEGGGGPSAKPARTVTDSDGRYSLRLPAAQRIGLAISKAGYSTLDLRSSDRTSIRLHPGVSETHDFELSKPATLSGHLIDKDSGRPLPGFYIHAIRWYAGLENSTGFRFPAAPTGTDGGFSIANLPPASYVVVVDPPMGGKIGIPKKDEAPKDETSYGSAWYPGVPRADMAAPVLLGYSENRDVVIRMQKRELHHIAGELRLPEGMEAGRIGVTLTTEAKGRPTGAEGEVPQPGPFRINGLEDGVYRVLAAGRANNGGARLFANTLVTISGSNVDDLNLEMRPGLSLSVSVRMAEEKSDPPKRFNFVPLSVDGWGPLGDDTPPGAGTQPVQKGLPPGKYRIAAMQMKGYAIESMIFNGVTLPPGSTVDLESAESGVTFVLTKELGDISGVVRDSAQRPLEDRTVLLMPEALMGAPREDSRLPAGLDETVTGAGGRFTFSGLAPGRYRAIALAEDERLREDSFDAIIGRIRQAESIVVVAGQTATTDLSGQ